MGGAAFGARSGTMSGGSSFGVGESSLSFVSSSPYSRMSNPYVGGGSRRLGRARSHDAVLGAGIHYTHSRSVRGRAGPPTLAWGYYGGYGMGGGLTGTLIVAALLAFAASQVVGGGGELGDGGGGNSVTVAKLQVGLLADGRRVQKGLEKTAGRVDTSTPEGLHAVLTETCLSLMRTPETCVYAHSEGRRVRGLSRGEEAFNAASLEERSKFKGETLVNVDGRTRRAPLGPGQGGDQVDELVVVTVLVAYEGKLKLPKCRDAGELAEALRTLGGLRQDQVLALEVLWTPSDEGDAYTADDLAADYPLLNTI